MTSKKLQKSHYKASKTLDFEGGRQTIFMASIPNSIQSASAVQSHMLSYIDEAVQQADKQHKSRVNSDSDWVRYGIDRVLHRAIQAWPFLHPAIVQLYRMRWDIEKVFDDFKNKLDETKAWSKSLTGKYMQAQFIVLAYNLLLRMRQHIEESEDLKEEAIIKKSEQRWGQTKKVYADAKKSIPSWLEKLRRITQISVKFIRWARALFTRQCSWDTSLELLDHEYGLK
ncbi:hypothetical protein BSZ32_01690 [Rubritalea profundi]|uniref:Transposase IS4-like domain-containing protein n=2 Tax=Rubritalea profundi TaxID=1658618 RepID=A0A2S7TYE1_9BACT|nr:hypothetical protein BSZ32_01690 [Rubritalea profundi]